MIKKYMKKSKLEILSNILILKLIKSLQVQDMHTYYLHYIVISRLTYE